MQEYDDLFSKVGSFHFPDQKSLDKKTNEIHPQEIIVLSYDVKNRLGHWANTYDKSNMADRIREKINIDRTEFTAGVTKTVPRVVNW
ncbi:unnamed protein product [Clonostachys rosea]|uniref:Uncharacterized protein n=1 Tax=Bionectria ochroleuca TaxID=29856 RepID=A0ABY6UG55_BIOOC|nr:unnamed protein product [Clonostachys rosea]